MTAAINVHEAKTHLSRLLDRAHAGEEITISKAGKPWAKLVKLDEPKPVKRKPGGWPELAAVPDEHWLEPLPDDELDAWDGKNSNIL